MSKIVWKCPKQFGQVQNRIGSIEGQGMSHVTYLKTQDFKAHGGKPKVKVENQEYCNYSQNDVTFTNKSCFFGMILGSIPQSLSSFVNIMVIWVVEFSREGYKIRLIFNQKSISSKEIIVFCKLT